MTLWVKTLPFTLWESEVSDSGRIAGYAYTHGLEGYGGDEHQAKPGDFVVVILSGQGEFVARDAHRRKESGVEDAVPMGAGSELLERPRSPPTALSLSRRPSAEDRRLQRSCIEVPVEPAVRGR